jgi:hypothetical protein
MPKARPPESTSQAPRTECRAMAPQRPSPLAKACTAEPAGASSSI